MGDVTKDHRYLTTFGRTRSEMVVPVIGRAGPALGLIDVESELVNAFNEGDRLALERCARVLTPMFALSDESPSRGEGGDPDETSLDEV